MKYELFIFKEKGLHDPIYKKFSAPYEVLTALFEISNNHCVLIGIKDDIRVVRFK